MMKRNQSAIQGLNMLLDVVLVYVVLLLVPRSGMKGIGMVSRGVYSAGLWLALALEGFYRTQRKTPLHRQVSRLAVTCGGLSALLALLHILLRRYPSPLLTYALLFAASSGALVIKYLFLHWLTGLAARFLSNRKQVILVGSGPLARRFVEDIRTHPEAGFFVNGYYGAASPEMDLVWMGSLEDLGTALKHTPWDEVVVALEPEEARHTRTVICQCRENGLSCFVVPPYPEVLSEHNALLDIGDTCLVALRQSRLDNPAWALVKRLLDILLSAALLVLLSPLMLVIAVGVKLSGPGPVLLRQERVGYRRRLFSMPVFRTTGCNDRKNSGCSTAKDCTRFGAWLRKRHLDTLPQLWNVLTGSMSLVGPQPDPPVSVKQFREQVPLYMLRHQVRPGMTGWAQVHGHRGDSGIQERVRRDLWYIRHWSLLLDAEILLRTLFGGATHHQQVSLCERSFLLQAGDRCFLALPLVQILYILNIKMINRIANNRLQCCIWAIIVLTPCTLWWCLRLLQTRRSVRLGGWLLLCNAIWVLITRLLLAEPFASAVYSSHWPFLFFCSYCCCALTDQSRRRRISASFTAIVCAVLLLWGVIGIWAAWTGQYVSNDLFLCGGIGLGTEGGDPPLIYLKLGGTHRNCTAFYYVMGSGLLLWQYRQSEKPLWRWAAVVSLPVFILVLALQHSRSCWVTGALVFSMSIGFAMQKRLRPGWQRHVVLVAVAIGGTLVLFLCFNPLSNAFTVLSESAQRLSAQVPALPEAADTASADADTQPERYGDTDTESEAESHAEPEAESYAEPEVESHAEPEQAADAQPAPVTDLVPVEEPTTLVLAEDRRDTLNDLMTLTLRTGIWAAIPSALREQPSILLIGQREDGMLDILNSRIPYPVPHTHNILFQQLMLAGLPSFLLYSAFLVWIAVLILRALFVRQPGPERYLAVVCGAAMVYGIVEPVLSQKLPFTSTVFLLLCGWLAGGLSGTPESQK